MRQSIFPVRTVFRAGETVTFRLDDTPGISGTAAVRTNLGRATVRRNEIIAAAATGGTPPGLDWRDIVMEHRNGGWELTLPLFEIGVFEAKCCFIPDDGTSLIWPSGDNYSIKVESAESAAGNTIYCAFVRQFGGSAELDHSPEPPVELAELERRGCTVLPPSGTFRDLIARLNHIFDSLGCRILQLLPIHPTPTVYGRMGLYGSPFAALDYFNVDPALADFDVKATPMEQFGELIDAVHARRGRIFMDIPVNHTGWASKLQSEHPDYFVRRADGTFESPGAWGTVWADLCKLDYKQAKVHELMAKVMLFWCRRGVDGFRCDAGYMLPCEAWSYITARVRREYPDTVFLLEGLGGLASVQENLLSRCGLDWGYSELFQNYNRSEISRYYPYMISVGHRCGALVDFAETHDNARLAATSQSYARLRFLVTALLADGAAFGFANGAEFFATEKIDVHGAGALNFGSEPNLVELIARLNALLADHPAFAPDSVTELIQRGPGNVLAARRAPADGGAAVLVLLNLDNNRSGEVYWPRDGFPSGGCDLLSGRRITFAESGADWVFHLDPGEGLCIDFKATGAITPTGRDPGAVVRCRAAAMAQRVAAALLSFEAAGSADGEAMRRNPENWVRDLVGSPLPPITVWHGGTDAKRSVMLPPGDVLLLTDSRDFRCRLYDGASCIAETRSLADASGRRFAFITVPRNDTGDDRRYSLRVIAFGTLKRVKKSESEILALAAASHRVISFEKNSGFDQAKAFASNRFGSYTMVQAAWGSLFSKYDALLAANIDRRYPVDRHVMFTRCRAWLVVNDYSQELNHTVMTNFIGSTDNRAHWSFAVPSGQGCRTRIDVELELDQKSDVVKLVFHRARANDSSDTPDTTPARLILRPDLEDRVNHEVTKAFMGPEQRFTQALNEVDGGFDFIPYDRKLSLRCDSGRFVREPEWHYMVELPLESDYGLDNHTDLFSPGYFEIRLAGGESTALCAAAGAAGTADAAEFADFKMAEFLDGGHGIQAAGANEFLTGALQRFVVKRDEFSTVMAGYPWFLDWGRDTLIVLRGLVTGVGFRAESAKIIRQFAKFERGGTIPNVIRGGEEANRDTSDAPLYLIIAARDYCHAVGNKRLLGADCGGRRLDAVLRSVIDNYRSGTPNGIVMDKESKLIFSPSHFTWMDTNFPAGTPREGYPIEIQALWFAALEFLGLNELAAEVSHSIETCFFSSGHCSDCLHAAPGTPAAQAVPDDHLRPNQLIALTLNAVKSPELRRTIIDDCAELLVPGGIRTLADRPVKYHLPVVRDGVQLNDPEHPYRGGYHGPEDTSRKVAYHNGTVWCWPFPAYCEALYLVGGKAVRERALNLLWSAAGYLRSGIPGQLPEVADGDAPHAPGGCPAQAWSISEFYRVYNLLSKTE